MFKRAVDTDYSILITIIVPTINRYNDLLNTLYSLSKQSIRDFEVIVVDQTLVDRRDISGESAVPVKYIQSNLQSASAARNIGILEAKGKYLLFLDDDVIINDVNFLQHYLGAYTSDPRVPGVVGCVLEDDQKITKRRHWLSRIKRNGWLFFPQNFGEFCLIESGRSCNLSVKRNIALAVNGMDENFEKGAHREEADFCVRVSREYGPFLFSPNACLYHIGNPVGGIRSWDSDIVKAQHHFDGAVYFMLKNVSWWDIPIHGFAIAYYFILPKSIRRHPKLLMLSLKRLWKGFKMAKQKLKQGPLYIHNEKIKDNK